MIVVGIPMTILIRPREDTTSKDPTTSSRYSEFLTQNETRKEAIKLGDWLQAIRLVDQLIAQNPKQADSLKIYRQHLESNLKVPSPLPTSPVIDQVLRVYTKRLEEAIADNNWIGAERVIEDIITAFPDQSIIWNTYRSQLRELPPLLDEQNWPAAIRVINQLSAKLPDQGPILQDYRRQVQQRIPTPPPTPTPFTSFPYLQERIPRESIELGQPPELKRTPRPRTTIQASPSPPPKPQYTPLSLPTFNPSAPPDKAFVCRLQPTLSYCKNFQPELNP